MVDLLVVAGQEIKETVAVGSCILLLMKMKSCTSLELQAGRNLCRSLCWCSSKTELLIFNFQLNYNISIFPFLLHTQIFGLRKLVVRYFFGLGASSVQ